MLLIRTQGIALNSLHEFFSYDFIQNACLAGSLAAIVSALIGYFIVLRGQVFASHALSHIAFAGAAGAGLAKLSPEVGQFLLTLFAALGMGTLEEKLAKSDLAIGMVLSFSLGLGILFLHFYTNYAGQAMAILFGDLFGVSDQLIHHMIFFSVISLAALFLLARRLLFVSIMPDVAEAKGVSPKLVSTSFFILLALAVTVASQVVGILLVFTLLVAPAASALCCTRTFWSGIILSLLIALFVVWMGIILSYLTNWPVSFWISALSFAIYILFRNFPHSFRHSPR